MRLDQFLIENGDYPSRARAQQAIAAGLVTVNGVPARKPSQKVGPGDEIKSEGDVHPYVSRGGLKLASALEAFGIDPQGRVCLDLGASTGGFCDVLLQRGAEKIYAVDVGHGQLHPRIRNDPRIVNLERTHAKDLSRALVPEPPALIVCDVSFISLKKALPPVLALAAPGAMLAALIKPQFEVGPDRLGKGGIVSETLHQPVIDDISAWLKARDGWRLIGVADSPIKGGDGNQEFLIGARKTSQEAA